MHNKQTNTQTPGNTYKSLIYVSLFEMILQDSDQFLITPFDGEHQVSTGEDYLIE